MKTLVKHILFIIIGLSLYSCKSDKPQIEPANSLPQEGNRIWICNEGNFQLGNAALGIYNPDVDEYASKVYQLSNSTSLGDVLQSVSFIDDRAYLIVNNSGKILVVDTGDFQLVQSITGFSSPRYLLQVATGKAYVSDLYADAISVLDLNNYQISKQINCGSWTERMLLFKDKAFISMPQNDMVYVIDIMTDTVMDSIKVDYGSNSLVLDRNDKLWVLCSGSQAKNKEAGLFRIDPQTLTVEQRIALDNSKLPSNLQIDADGSHLFFLEEDLFKMNINALARPLNAFYEANGRVFYGFNIDHQNSELYISDAKDYVQNGQAYRLDSLGQLISSFQTNINPNGFFFE